MSDYVKGLREYVGHAPLILCGASVLVENGRGELLLQYRRDNESWGYPGGAMELGEAPEETARRELYEETGLTAGPLELFGVFSGEAHRYRYPNGDEVQNVDVVYFCREWTGAPRPDGEEGRELRFFPPEALPAPLNPPDVPVLRKYAKRKKSE